MPGLPPLGGQSALSAQTSRFTLLHVSHWHRRPAYPMPRQRGWAAVTVRVWLAVLRFNSMVSTPIELPEAGQSRLTSPRWPEPCTVHGWPFRGPFWHVPALQVGHGFWRVFPP
jgi:hypothetical protein